MVEQKQAGTELTEILDEQERNLQLQLDQQERDLQDEIYQDNERRRQEQEDEARAEKGLRAEKRKDKEKEPEPEIKPELERVEEQVERRVEERGDLNASDLHNYIVNKQEQDGSKPEQQSDTRSNLEKWGDQKQLEFQYQQNQSGQSHQTAREKLTEIRQQQGIEDTVKEPEKQQNWEIER